MPKQPVKHVFFHDTESSQAIENESVWTPAGEIHFSYFWITSLKTYNKYRSFAYDELTAERLYKHYPTFTGIDDMEGHFEFVLNATEARSYLLGLGMVDGDTLTP